MKKILIVLLFCTTFLNSQAEIFPLPLDFRVQEASHVVYAEVKAMQSFWDNDHRNIYTAYQLEILAQWKGSQASSQLCFIEIGGTVGNDMQITSPSVELAIGQQGIFLLSPSDVHCSLFPYASLLQMKAPASIQSFFDKNQEQFIDVANPNEHFSLAKMYEQLQMLCQAKPKTVAGKIFTLQDFQINKKIKSANKTLAVSFLTDGNNNTTTTFFAGTSNDAPLEMIINGSGFGASPGTINFPDASAGGGANIFTFPGSTSTSGYASDIISWTNTQIRIRVPRGAGTGTLEVFNSSNISQGSASIVIDWAIIALYNTFSGFASNTSQSVKMVNRNSNGGYTFNLSTNGSANMFTNIPAKEALRRSLTTWRCGTHINFNLNLNSGTTSTYANDNESVILFDNSLPSGVLGRNTSRFSGFGSAGCNLYNTLWYLNEADLQFQVIPFTATTWNFNSSGTTASQFSFESVALHELGHAHGLGHVVDVAKTMHYSISSGTDKTSLSSAEINAGIYKLSYSTVPFCVTSQSPMITLNPLSACVPLPVDLVSFNANKVNEKNQILWETQNASFINKYHLQISNDGKHFENIYSTVANNTIFSTTYSFQHIPLRNKNYYQLAIEDIDGNMSYSHIIFLERKDVNHIALYPNPSSDIISIQLSGTHAQTVPYKIIQAHGALVQSGKLAVQNETSALEISSLAHGHYILQIQINQVWQNLNLIKN